MPSILAIDDNRDNLTTIAALLKNLLPDCALITACSGQEGIDRARAEQPDAILLDIVMPGMDGFETCRRLKADDRSSHIPVIMLTAIRTEPQSRLRALETGADAFLTKPIDPYELVAQVKVALRIKAAEDCLRDENRKLERLIDQKIGDLRISEEKLSKIFQASPDSLTLSTLAEQRYIEVNDAFLRLIGAARETVIGRTTAELGILADPAAYERALEIIRRTGSLKDHEIELRMPDGQTRTVLWCAEAIDFAGKACTINAVKDITDRKRAVEERETTIKLLSLLNSENGLREILRLICTFLHDWSGCEAVGIRLRDGNDFPYAETRGFPGEFVEAENRLCVESHDDRPAVEEIGNPALECMCGNVLCGRFDPAKPFFTPHGSFWSNCTTELLATTTAEDRQARTRNRCNGEGYESVALIPLRLGKTTFGLIQLNDKRRGRFTPGFIAQMERMGDSIAVSLAQRKTQQALLAKEQQLSRVMETSPVGIVQIAVDGQIVFANPQAERILGLTKDRLADMTYNAPAWRITDFAGNPFPEDQLPFRRVIATGEPVYDVRHAIGWPDGTRVLLSINAAPLLNEAGGVEGVVAALSDITEHFRVAEEHTLLEERLHRAEKMESLGQLAGGVAHDLNNILGVSTVYSELLKEKIPDENPLRRYVDHILSSQEKAAAIIQDLLTLARRSVVAADVINLNDVIAGFLRTPVFEKIQGYYPNVTFRTQAGARLLNIRGSAVHIEKTLMNLVANAAEAIAGKGAVTITTENRYLDRPLSGYDAVREGDYAVLTVSDTGAGIPAESIEKIFEPFYTKKTMGRSGTGLGLAIVWGTVKDHGGYIDVQTEVGRGSVFTLFFPVTREEPAAARQKSPVERYLGRGESILVVDDSAEQRDVAQRLLGRLGYTVHLAAGGEEAVEFLKGRSVDLVLLDMIMDPGIDGLETYRRIVALRPGQKAIIVSGFAETDRVRTAQELGAGAYVRKPYLMETIGTAIRDELRTG